jgi:hypothetical protein
MTFLLMVVLPTMLFSQTQSKKKTFQIAKQKTFSPSQVKTDWFVHLQNKDTVMEGNRTYQSFMESVKKNIDTYHYSSVHNHANNQLRTQENKVDTPLISYAFEGNRYSGSAPNDNTMAISNDGVVVAAINTNIIFYDTKTDSLWKTVSLSNFSDTLSTVSKHQYDPKAIYDYKEDRFILVYLAGTKSYESDIIVAFSETSNPMGNWNFYSLPGNPLNDTSWTDYPAIALNNDELIITGNLLRDGGSWQTSFKQSVVWQIDKFDGYKGDSLNLVLHHDIAYNNKNVRNIHPVRGGNAYYGPEIYLLSNQNFALESDTFYFIKISDNLSNPKATLTVDLLQSDVKYGMPPNAKQPGVKLLATNDARVLGAFYQNGEIQFVGNSVHLYVDTDTNRLAGFYHGVVKNVAEVPDLHLNIFNDEKRPKMEYGYPNLSYCGTNSLSQHSLITFDYSAQDFFPSFGASFFEKDDTYSPLTNLKTGNTNIYVLWNTQRWGDYSGTQPKYNEPGKVWASGTFGKKVGAKLAYGTWIAEIYSKVEDIPLPSTDFSAKAYPNPPQNNQMFIEFNLPKSQKIQVEIVDINGRRVALLYDADAKAGMNTFSFSTTPLENGLYIVRILDENDLLYSQKITVVQ